MNNARRRRCQTACVITIASFASAFSAQAETPVPAWQNELTAARLVATAAGDNQPPAVAKSFRDLAAKYPSNPAVQKACGDYFWTNDDPNEAMPLWLGAQTLAPHDAEISSSLGAAYLRLGRIPQTAAEFERAVADAPDNAVHHFDLANVLSLFRHELGGESALIRAISEYRRAAELSAGDRRFAQAYAEAFYVLAKPDWESARTAWLTVRTLSGESSDFANIHLARISLNMKRPEEAATYLSLVKDPAFSPVRDKLQSRLIGMSLR